MNITQKFIPYKEDSRHNQQNCHIEHGKRLTYLLVFIERIADGKKL